jgi:hypothetical protein
MAGEKLAGGGDVGIPQPVEQRNGEIPEGRQGLVSMGRTGGGTVLTEDRIAHPMQLVLDPPVRLP